MNDHDDTSHYEGALLEEIRDMFRALQEGQEAMINVPSDIEKIKATIVVIQSDIISIKEVVKVHSGQIDNHEGRIIKLEKAAA